MRPGGESAGAGASKEPCECATECDEQHGLGEQLAKELGAPGAEREAHTELALTIGTAREDEHHDIAERDEQDEGDHRHHHFERRAVLLCVAGECLGGSEGEDRRLLARVRTTKADEGCLCQNCLGLGKRLLLRDARGEAREQRQAPPGGLREISLAVVGRRAPGIQFGAGLERYPEVNGSARLRAFEAGGGDADDGEWHTFDEERLSEDIG